MAVDLQEVQKIFSCFGTYGFNILRFFLNIVCSISDDKVLKMSQDDMVNKWHMGKTTVNNYARKLVEIGLLCIVDTDERAKGYLRCCEDLEVTA